MITTEPHDYTPPDAYCCEVCWCSYHCARCNNGSSMHGHYVIDADGGYFHCEEPDRWERQCAALWEKLRAPR